MELIQGDRQAKRIPCFIQEEIQRFDTIFSTALDRNAPVFAVTCKNLSLQGQNIELLAAAYLLTNIVFMGYIKKQILKLIYIKEDDLDKAIPILNILRSLFNSEFSSLHELNTWRGLLESKAQLSAPSLLRIQEAVEFMDGAGITENVEFFRRADIFFGVHCEKGESVTSPYEIANDEAFSWTISTAERKLRLLMPEIFISHGVTVGVERQRSVIMVEVDFKDHDWLKAWMQNVEVVAMSKLFAGRT